jgi:hypothetical protein
MASRIPAVGRVTVSLRKSIIENKSFSSSSAFCRPSWGLVKNWRNWRKTFRFSCQTQQIPTQTSYDIAIESKRVVVQIRADGPKELFNE